MDFHTWIRFSILFLYPEPKDLSPPPLNPHPNQALHITVAFDNPEDAKRYAIVMSALYQNQQHECGYFDPIRGGGMFIYPNQSFDIPNESQDPQRALFNIYIDRYNLPKCNWELVSPYFKVVDTLTGRRALSSWGYSKDLVPGTEYKHICQFREDDFPQTCYHNKPVIDVPHYSRIPITVQVSKDSALLRPSTPGYFDTENFVKPIPHIEMNPSSPKNNH
ncbi:hypothetical protein L2Y94_09095 [Luteibacter aegosomatis]|uniref:hypothetical protein n=1 Tax=Luteibacter aegosomatis TaxID=2911537 RepID=UPI001FFB9EA0|nr:hypothetical protein [Luteibacter aegosomatis]UPG87489.1 hypothetical protein L2Y94_09095 [Luteibacter aegosomatis]